MKIVLDTNILIAYALGDENAKHIIKFIKSGVNEILADKRLLNEYILISKRQKFKFDNNIQKELSSFYKNYLKIIEIDIHSIKFNPDRDDSKILEIANTADCDYIITNDKQLIKRGNRLTTSKIIDCEGFVSLIKQNLK